MGRTAQGLQTGLSNLDLAVSVSRQIPLPQSTRGRSTTICLISCVHALSVKCHSPPCMWARYPAPSVKHPDSHSMLVPLGLWSTLHSARNRSLSPLASILHEAWLG
ncbi:hypothetical protein Cob_v000248 [Colletotrichum orbiculare MAFF 240422]|uniref:Uncharacterized protein n=1 Tax=Colletotrichum orbiculare (strain 104-T / ATCC 96160 / CBS 514.97 / LARS 414 / MAFF 240422) TaxID=1213857 RepID=A0A484G7S6_COLOR|nr:hypothetical protein Cob_v000248 [Colletotrichum orbiculare MAFF 240422]